MANYGRQKVTEYIKVLKIAELGKWCCLNKNYGIHNRFWKGRDGIQNMVEGSALDRRWDKVGRREVYGKDE